MKSVKSADGTLIAYEKTGEYLSIKPKHDDNLSNSHQYLAASGQIVNTLTP